MNSEKKYIQEITVLEGRGTKSEEKCVYKCHEDYSFRGLSLDEISNKMRMGELFISFRCNEENVGVRIDEIVKLHLSLIHI